MAIAIGDRLPEATFRVMTPDGIKEITTGEVFGGKKVVLFAVPGAFTPTCHLKHLPGFIESADEFKKLGIDTVACVAVNDPFVLGAWEEKSGGKGKVLFLSDGNAEFTKKIGMDFDGSGVGLGTRSKRYAALVEDGVVKALNIEDSPGVAVESTAAKLLATGLRLASFPTLAEERRHALAGKLVGALIVVMADMAFDPMPADFVAVGRLLQPLPQLGILHRLPVRGAPAVLLPAFDPAGDAAAQIIGVGIELDVRRRFQRIERLDRGDELHAVIGGQLLAAFDLFAVRARFEDRAPAAGSRIAGTGAVGMDHHLGPLSHARAAP